MNKETSIEVFNSLLEINNDRIAGYETAINETDEADLKALFSALMQTSQKCKAELVAEVRKLGGLPVEGTKATGKLYRLWMDFKSAITSKDRKTILNSCEFGEDVAVGTYEKAIRDTDALTAEQLTMLNTQYALIKADHDKVKNLRDVMVEAK